MKKLEKMLWEGIHGNDLRKVALALNLGADVNAKDKWGRSPLRLAVSRGYVAIAELLISAGADVNAKDDGLWAVLRDSVPIAKLLISVGADVNAKDGFGNSPLHMAVAMDNVALAKLLISAGADVNAKDNGGKSTLDYANSEEMKDLLQGVMT